MILILKATGRDGLFRDFTCQLDRLELALDVLSRLVAQGETLHEAYIIDRDARLTLPVDVFDGQPFEQPMLRLEKEWQLILNTPIRTSGR